MNGRWLGLCGAVVMTVSLASCSAKALQDTVTDHRLIMEFLDQRNAEGARNAMKIHIMHAMKELDME